MVAFSNIMATFGWGEIAISALFHIFIDSNWWNGGKIRKNSHTSVNSWKSQKKARISKFLQIENHFLSQNSPYRSAPCKFQNHIYGQVGTRLPFPNTVHVVRRPRIRHNSHKYGIGSDYRFLMFVISSCDGIFVSESTYWHCRTTTKIKSIKSERTNPENRLHYSECYDAIELEKCLRINVEKVNRKYIYV